MRIALIGPPGSGKSTIASLLSTHNNIPRLSCGDFIRGADDKYPWVRPIIGPYDVNSGMLADPQAVCEIMLKAIDIERVNASVAEEGRPPSYVLDGSPRTEYEAEQYLNLSSGMTPSLYVIFDTREEVCIERLSTRYIHKPSGRTYNAKNPPKKFMVDDVTGEPLEVRGDDDPDKIRVRLAQYMKLTLGAVEVIRDGVASVEQSLYADYDILIIRDDGSLRAPVIAHYISQIAKKLETLRKTYTGHWSIRMTIDRGYARFKIETIRTPKEERSCISLFKAL